MSTIYSWKKAKALLTETEKDRLCCLFFTCAEQIKPTGDDFEIAAKEFGAAKGGFTKMYQTTLKKLKDNNAYVVEGEDDDDAAAGAGAGTDNAETEKEKPKKGAGRKRKAPEGDDAGGETKPKKPRAPRQKKGDAKVKKEKVAEDESEKTEGAEDV